MFRGELSYDGTDYFGWQLTESGPSIEGVLLNVMERIFREPPTLAAASRTDRGVHAKGQVISFESSTSYSVERLLVSINALLPPSIRLWQLEELFHPFHATLESLGKRYRYSIFNRKVEDPLKRRSHWHVPDQLDQPLMRSFAQQLWGRHDFSTFQGTKGRRLDTICHLFSLNIESREEEVDIILTADRFLYHMARKIVGAVVKVGSHFVDPTLLLAGWRKGTILDIYCAPPHGLTLEKVYYTHFPSNDG